MPQPSTTAKAAPKHPTGAAAYRQLAEQGVLWTAPSGAVIRVRDLTIADRALMLSFPQELQDVVATIIEQSPSLKAEADDDAREEIMALLGGEERSALTVLDREYQLGVHACIACWIEPVVVLNPDDVTDPETQIHAAQIVASDRRAFMAKVFGGDAAEVASLATFRGKPS